MEQEVENSRYALEKASFSLGWVKLEGKELLDKLIDMYSDSCKSLKSGCDAAKQAVAVLDAQISQSKTAA